MVIDNLNLEVKKGEFEEVIAPDETIGRGYTLFERKR